MTKHKLHHIKQRTLQSILRDVKAAHDLLNEWQPVLDELHAIKPEPATDVRAALTESVDALARTVRGIEAELEP